MGFSGGRSRRTWREPSTMGMQLVNIITCGCESSAPFLVIYKAGREPTPYWLYQLLGNPTIEPPGHFVIDDIRLISKTVLFGTYSKNIYTDTVDNKIKTNINTTPQGKVPNKNLRA